MTSWIPEQTRIFVVGTLKWEDTENFTPFDSESRKDAELVQYFSDAGVPAANIKYLCDEEALTETVKSELRSFLGEAGEEETLFFYYCGHGYEVDNQYCFATYDCNDELKLPIRTVVDYVHKYFTGTSAILTADCCHSGYLSQCVQKKIQQDGDDGRIWWAALTSVQHTTTSTGNWTFSNALLDALNGKPWLEFDNDGCITLDEVAQHIHHEMALVETQVASTCVPYYMKDFVITANIAAKKHKRIGERVMVDYEGTDYLARIEDVEEGQFYVRYFSYDSAEVGWVDDSVIKVHRPKHYAIGTSLQVLSEDDNKWYACSVLKSFCGMHLIRYDEYDECYDEWVTMERLRTY